MGSKSATPLLILCSICCVHERIIAGQVHEIITLCTQILYSPRPPVDPYSFYLKFPKAAVDVSPPKSSHSWLDRAHP